MEQALMLPETNDSFFKDELKKSLLQRDLDELSLKKMSWEHFRKKIKDFSLISRLKSTQKARTLLHLAVLDNQIDMIKILKEDASLKSRRDLFGLTPVDMAQFLNRKELLHLLEAPKPALFPSFPKLEEFNFLSHPIFETQDGFEQVLVYASRAKEEDKIPPEKIWMGIYFDKEIQKGIHPPLSIRKINPEIGFGVFADKRIPPCTYIGEYTGMIQERKPKELRDKNYCLRYTMWEAKKNFAIDAEQCGNFTRFINHSFEPNVAVQSVYWRGIPRMIFIALKEIPEGRQLVFDYGPCFWKYQSKIPQKLDEFKKE